jgi:hypothetical protein
MLVIIEEAAGLVVPMADHPALLTLGDAFQYYQAACRAAQAAR